MGINWIDTDKCNGCGFCEQICPQDVIRMDKTTGKAHIAYLRDCQSCFLCEMKCPQNAVFVTPFREIRAVLPW